MKSKSRTPMIDKHGDYEVLKCYLSGKRGRMMVFLTLTKGKYVPFSIIKKETKKGRNITKDNYVDLFEGEIQRVLKESVSSNPLI